MIKKILLSVIALIAAVGCAKNEIKEASELDKIIATNNYVIVDVRTKEEYEDERVSTSINIPYDEIDADVKLDKNKTIIVYCRSGSRSEIATKTLEELGYNVYDAGGIATLKLPKEKGSNRQ